MAGRDKLPSNIQAEEFVAGTAPYHRLRRCATSFANIQVAAWGGWMADLLPPVMPSDLRAVLHADTRDKEHMIARRARLSEADGRRVMYFYLLDTAVGNRNVGFVKGNAAEVNGDLRTLVAEIDILPGLPYRQKGWVDLRSRL